MLGNRREFLKYMNIALNKEPVYNENFTKELHQTLLKKLKDGLPTCPIVCMEGSVFEQVRVRLGYANCNEESKQSLAEIKDEINKDHEENLKKIDSVTKSLIAMNADKVDDPILNKFAEEHGKSMVEISKDMLKKINRLAQHSIKVAEAKRNEALTLLDNIINNPLDYESKGMPFEMLMLISTDQDGLLGIMFVELDPERWMVLEVDKQVTPNLTGANVQVSVQGGITVAEDDAVKVMDYLLNQRANIIEIEPTSIGLGQHISFLSRKTRQLPQHVLYIGTKKKFLKDYPQQASRIMRKPIFAHMVKGHWRVLWGKQHQGKDRHGKPIFNGYTWVTAHKRGKGELTDNPVYVVKQS